MLITRTQRRLYGAIAVATLVAGCVLGGCSGREEPEAPLPALSQPGLRWQVTRGDRPVFAMANSPGRIRWSSATVEHPFLDGESLDRHEEARLRQLVRRSRHFRDFVRQLERAGYGVAADGQPSSAAPRPS